MFSPPADTTFSSFFSRAGLGAGHLQHLEWLLRLAPPWKMRQGSLLLGQDARLPVTPSFTEYTLVTLHHSFPRIFSGSGFARASPRWRLRPSSPARVQSPVRLRGPRWAKEGLRELGWLCVVRRLRASDFFLGRRIFIPSKDSKAEAFPWPEPGSGPGHGPSIDWCRMKTTGSRPLLRLPLDRGDTVLVAGEMLPQWISQFQLLMEHPHPDTRGRLTLLGQVPVWSGAQGVAGAGATYAVPAAWPECPGGSTHWSSFNMF